MGAIKGPCHACQTLIWWLDGAHGMQPVEVAPSSLGTLIVDLDKGTYVALPSGPQLMSLRGQLHLNHRAACAMPKRVRRTRKGSGKKTRNPQQAA